MNVTQEFEHFSSVDDERGSDVGLHSLQNLSKTNVYLVNLVLRAFYASSHKQKC